MALTDLSVLDGFKVGGFPADYPADRRTFFSPIDDVPKVLAACLASAQRSVYVAMFGFADPVVSKTLIGLLENEHVLVQMALDSTQAAGVGEKRLLADWAQQIGNSVSVGRSEHGAIQHLKVLVIDGELVIHGSTNLSVGGETLQDNELTVQLNRAVAASFTDRVMRIHDVQLKQMAAKAAKAA
jgi:phosphatidylserine/phosphatidylglycerophosphate/cardiolipin synthase-like enzyme